MSPVQSVSPALALANNRPTTNAPARPADGFWQQKFARDVLPFVTSLSLHAGVILLGLLTYTAIRAIRLPVQIQTSPADSPIVENTELGVFGANPDKPWEKPAQDRTHENTDPTGASSFASAAKINMGLTGGGDPNDASASVIAIGPGAFGLGNKSGAGTGPGDAAGNGEGKTGPWGLTPNIGGNPRAATFEPARYAHQIVFLCDATGSMLNKIATLKDELNKAVIGLRPSQSFDILFYQGSNIQSFAKVLMPATPENKRKASLWLENVSPQDVTNPIPALEMAMQLHPEVVYFLTDAADFPDARAVTDTIEKYNRDRKIKINTILFVEDRAEHEKNADSEGLMKKIALDSGGKFRWVEMDAIESK